MFRTGNIGLRVKICSFSWPRYLSRLLSYETFPRCVAFLRRLLMSLRSFWGRRRTVRV